MSPIGPQVFHWSLFEFFQKFAEIFANECLSPVSTTPAINLCHGFSVNAGDVDTGEQFIAGDNDTGDNFIADDNDTGEQLSPVTTTPAINLSSVTTTLAITLSPGTTTPVNNYRRCCCHQ